MNGDRAFQSRNYDIFEAQMKGVHGFGTTIKTLDGPEVYVICPDASQLATVFDLIRPDRRFDPGIVQEVVVVAQDKMGMFARRKNDQTEARP